MWDISRRYRISDFSTALHCGQAWRLGLLLAMANIAQAGMVAWTSIRRTLATEDTSVDFRFGSIAHQICLHIARDT
jgi:hypothetical protein